MVLIIAGRAQRRDATDLPGLSEALSSLQKVRVEMDGKQRGRALARAAQRVAATLMPMPSSFLLA